MSDKNKAILGLVIFVVASFYMIFSGMGERYNIALWGLGGLTGLALGKALGK